MSWESLTEREKEILQALIDHYILTAEPVGSKVISDKYALGLSSATVRNSLKDLEEMNLVQQPHISAGRIPTDKGYRVYVDQLIKKEKLTEEEKAHIKTQIMIDFGALDEILEQTSKILGTVSNLLGVTLAPQFDKGVLTRIELIPVAERKILVVLAVKSGLFRTILLEAQSDISSETLQETARVLNERLCGFTMGELKASQERLKDTTVDVSLIKLFLDSTENIVSSFEPEHLHFGGTTNIAEQPEFKDPEKLRSFIKLLEERKSLIELITSKGLKEGITVVIGKETDLSETPSLSLVTSTYQVGKVTGTVGVIGPTRMKYSKLVSIVDYTAKVLTEVLSK